MVHGYHEYLHVWDAAIAVATTKMRFARPLCYSLMVKYVATCTKLFLVIVQCNSIPAKIEATKQNISKSSLG